MPNINNSQNENILIPNNVFVDIVDNDLIKRNEDGSDNKSLLSNNIIKSYFNNINEGITIEKINDILHNLSFNNSNYKIIFSYDNKVTTLLLTPSNKNDVFVLKDLQYTLQNVSTNKIKIENSSIPNFITVREIVLENINNDMIEFSANNQNILKTKEPDRVLTAIKQTLHNFNIKDETFLSLNNYKGNKSRSGVNMYKNYIDKTVKILRNINDAEGFEKYLLFNKQSMEKYVSNTKSYSEILNKKLNKKLVNAEGLDKILDSIPVYGDEPLSVIINNCSSLKYVNISTDNVVNLDIENCKSISRISSNIYNNLTIHESIKSGEQLNSILKPILNPETGNKGFIATLDISYNNIEEFEVNEFVVINLYADNINVQDLKYLPLALNLLSLENNKNIDFNTIDIIPKLLDLHSGFYIDYTNFNNASDETKQIFNSDLYNDLIYKKDKNNYIIDATIDVSKTDNKIEHETYTIETVNYIKDLYKIVNVSELLNTDKNILLIANKLDSLATSISSAKRYDGANLLTTFVSIDKDYNKPVLKLFNDFIDIILKNKTVNYEQSINDQIIDKINKVLSIIGSDCQINDEEFYTVEVKNAIKSINNDYNNLFSINIIEDVKSEDYFEEYIEIKSESKNRVNKCLDYINSSSVDTIKESIVEASSVINISSIDSIIYHSNKVVDFNKKSDYINILNNINKKLLIVYNKSSEANVRYTAILDILSYVDNLSNIFSNNNDDIVFNNDNVNMLNDLIESLNLSLVTYKSIYTSCLDRKYKEVLENNKEMIKDKTKYNAFAYKIIVEYKKSKAFIDFFIQDKKFVYNRIYELLENLEYNSIEFIELYKNLNSDYIIDLLANEKYNYENIYDTLLINKDVNFKTDFKNFYNSMVESTYNNIDFFTQTLLNDICNYRAYNIDYLKTEVIPILENEFIRNQYMKYVVNKIVKFDSLEDYTISLNNLFNNLCNNISTQNARYNEIFNKTVDYNFTLFNNLALEDTNKIKETYNSLLKPEDFVKFSKELEEIDNTIDSVDNKGNKKSDLFKEIFSVLFLEPNNFVNVFKELKEIDNTIDSVDNKRNKKSDLFKKMFNEFFNNLSSDNNLSIDNNDTENTVDIDDNDIRKIEAFIEFLNTNKNSNLLKEMFKKFNLSERKYEDYNDDDKIKLLYDLSIGNLSSKLDYVNNKINNEIKETFSKIEDINQDTLSKIEDINKETLLKIKDINKETLSKIKDINKETLTKEEKKEKIDKLNEEKDEKIDNLNKEKNKEIDNLNKEKNEKIDNLNKEKNEKIPLLIKSIFKNSIFFNKLASLNNDEITYLYGKLISLTPDDIKNFSNELKNINNNEKVEFLKRSFIIDNFINNLLLEENDTIKSYIDLLSLNDRKLKNDFIVKLKNFNNLDEEKFRKKSVLLKSTFIEKRIFKDKLSTDINNNTIKRNNIIKFVEKLTSLNEIDYTNTNNVYYIDTYFKYITDNPSLVNIQLNYYITSLNYMKDKKNQFLNILNENYKILNDNITNIEQYYKSISMYKKMFTYTLDNNNLIPSTNLIKFMNNKGYEINEDNIAKALRDISNDLYKIVNDVIYCKRELNRAKLYSGDVKEKLDAIISAISYSTDTQTYSVKVGDLINISARNKIENYNIYVNEKINSIVSLITKLSDYSKEFVKFGNINFDISHIVSPCYKLINKYFYIPEDKKNAIIEDYYRYTSNDKEYFYSLLNKYDKDGLLFNYSSQYKKKNENDTYEYVTTGSLDVEYKPGLFSLLFFIEHNNSYIKNISNKESFESMPLLKVIYSTLDMIMKSVEDECNQLKVNILKGNQLSSAKYNELINMYIDLSVKRYNISDDSNNTIELKKLKYEDIIEAKRNFNIYPERMNNIFDSLKQWSKTCDNNIKKVTSSIIKYDINTLKTDINNVKTKVIKDISNNNKLYERFKDVDLNIENVKKIIKFAKSINDTIIDTSNLSSLKSMLFEELTYNNLIKKGILVDKEFNIDEFIKILDSDKLNEEITHIGTSNYGNSLINLLRSIGSSRNTDRRILKLAESSGIDLTKDKYESTTKIDKENLTHILRIISAYNKNDLIKSKLAFADYKVLDKELIARDNSENRVISDSKAILKACSLLITMYTDKKHNIESKINKIGTNVQNDDSRPNLNAVNAYKHVLLYKMKLDALLFGNNNAYSIIEKLNMIDNILSNDLITSIKTHYNIIKGYYTNINGIFDINKQWIEKANIILSEKENDLADILTNRTKNIIFNDVKNILVNNITMLSNMINSFITSDNITPILKYDNYNLISKITENSFFKSFYLSTYNNYMFNLASNDYLNMLSESILNNTNKYKVIDENNNVIDLLVIKDTNIIKFVKKVKDSTVTINDLPLLQSLGMLIINGKNYKTYYNDLYDKSNSVFSYENIESEDILSKINDIDNIEITNYNTIKDFIVPSNDIMYIIDSIKDTLIGKDYEIVYRNEFEKAISSNLYGNLSSSELANKKVITSYKFSKDSIINKIKSNTSEIKENVLKKETKEDEDELDYETIETINKGITLKRMVDKVININNKEKSYKLFEIKTFVKIKDSDKNVTEINNLDYDDRIKYLSNCSKGVLSNYVEYVKANIVILNDNSELSVEKLLKDVNNYKKAISSESAITYGNYTYKDSLDTINEKEQIKHENNIDKLYYDINTFTSKIIKGDVTNSFKILNALKKVDYINVLLNRVNENTVDKGYNINNLNLSSDKFNTINATANVGINNTYDIVKNEEFDKLIDDSSELISTILRTKNEDIFIKANNTLLSNFSISGEIVKDEIPYNNDVKNNMYTLYLYTQNNKVKTYFYKHSFIPFEYRNINENVDVNIFNNATRFAELVRKFVKDNNKTNLDTFIQNNPNLSYEIIDNNIYVVFTNAKGRESVILKEKFIK